MVSFFGTDTSPSSACSSPVIMRKSVVLPDPLGPTRPTFSPGLSWKEASTKRTWRPYCLLILVKETTPHQRITSIRSRSQAHHEGDASQSMPLSPPIGAPGGASKVDGV